jgi:hypothetical protein
VGTVKVSPVNPGVFANLTENFVQNGVQVLKCELNISQFSYHPDDISVICVNVGLDTEDSYRVQVKGLIIDVGCLWGGGGGGSYTFFLFEKN